MGGKGRGGEGESSMDMGREMRSVRFKKVNKGGKGWEGEVM